MQDAERHSEVRYELTETPPPALALALSAQTVALIVAGILLTPVIVLRAGGAESFAPWAIFAALVVSGLGQLDAASLGADGFLAKPFTRTSLLAAVQRALTSGTPAAPGP